MNNAIVMVIIAICLAVFVVIGGFFALLGKVTRYNEESILHILLTRGVFVLFLIICMVGVIIFLNSALS